MRAYSLDLRQRVVRAYEQGHGSMAEIAEQFSVSTGFDKIYAPGIYEIWMPSEFRGGIISWRGVGTSSTPCRKTLNGIRLMLAETWPILLK